MAAFDHFRDLNDVALKPRLLRTLLREQLPDDSHPFREPSELSSIVSILKTHNLLSEELPPPSANPKLLSTWNSSVDAFVDRILLLARSNLPDKCWAGVCLLGVMCTECSSARFLASYSDWFNVLLSHIQLSGASKYVTVATCAAMSDLLTRLGGFSNLKKDGNSHAAKLVQPILKMFNEDVTEAVLEIAAQLLLTILNYFPSSALHHLENAEGVIVSKIMAANCSAGLLKKLSCCLASLPKSKGDEVSWSLMMQKILLSVSALLNSTLEGLEEETRRREAVTLLIPPGKDPPSSLGGRMMTGEASNTRKSSQKSTISSISSLMQCCCIMLTNSYPVQVAIPVHPLLALIRRVLMVNGSLPEMSHSFTTAMQQEYVCLQLPVLHLNVLEVLAAVVKGLHSQLLPHAADIMWLLLKYFKTCWLPELRTKVYTIIRALLISMGAGMALYISEEVIDNGIVDLKFADSKNDVAFSDEQSCIEASLHLRKKRKHGSSTGLFVEQQVLSGSEPKECQASLHLKIVALETLEALLMMGGALKCDSWRRRIDDLMVEVATYACRDGWIHDGTPFYYKETRLAWEDFQLVALRALLASLLSPAGYRSPYLSKGLELFHAGKQNTGTKVAEFCAQALLASEVLVHPRALPLIDMPLANGNSYSLGKTDFGGSKYKLPDIDGVLRTRRGNPHDVYDFLNDIYLGDNTGLEVAAVEVHKDLQCDEQMLDVSRDQNHEEPNVINCLPDKVMPKEKDAGSEQANLDNKIESCDGRIRLDAQPYKTLAASITCDNEKIGLAKSSVLSAKKGLENNRSDVNTSDSLNRASSSSGLVVENAATAHADNSALKMSVKEQDDESSDSFPDIVDADPDTDSEID